MAIVKGIFQATGSIKGISFYSIAGSDKVIMRTKGGPSKARMATGKEFEKLRKHQTEWAACVLFARAVRGAVGDLYRMSDFNLSPVWTGMGKSLLKLDTVGEVGKRALLLSTYKQALEGFNFNRNHPYSSILRVSHVYEMNRATLQATVTFPRINTAMDLVNLQHLPYFRLVVSLGTVSNIVFAPVALSNYTPTNDQLQGYSVSAASMWFSTNDRLPEQVMQVAFEERFQHLLTEDITLLLSIGVEFGNVGFGGEIVEVKRAGYAKIVAVR